MATAIAAVVGVDELQLLVGLTFVTVALWPLLARLALVVPGGILVWLALPSRAPFVHRPPVDVEKGPRPR